MKKKIVSIIMVAAMTAVLAVGCGQSEPAPAPGGSTGGDTAGGAASEPEVVLKLGHNNPATGLTGLTYDKYAEYVAELSNGTMKIEVYPGGSLVSDQDSFAGVMDGTIDMIHDTVNRQTGVIADLAVLEIPGYYTGSEDDWLTFVDEIREPIDALYEDIGVKYIAASYQGTSVVLSNKTKIEEASDMKGMTIRAMGTYLSKSVEAWGGAPVTLGLADLPNGLERGTVDGAYTGWCVAVPNKFYELTDYMAYTGFCETYADLLMNLETFNSLTPEQQEILLEAGKMMEEYSLELAQSMDADGRDAAAASGCEVYEWTADQQATFLKDTDALYDEVAPTLSDKGKALNDVVQTWKQK